MGGFPYGFIQAFFVINVYFGVGSEPLRKILDDNLARTTVGKISLEYLSGKKSKEVEL